LDENRCTAIGAEDPRRQYHCMGVATPRLSATWTKAGRVRAFVFRITIPRTDQQFERFARERVILASFSAATGSSREALPKRLR